jgi:type IV pilus assembly protein PilV
MKRQGRNLRLARRQQAGFTLIEVMIAVLVMGIGLLGFAMLQTMNVRFTKSAQERTVATNLAYELIDLMRSQRAQASYYNGVTYGSFAGITGNEANCAAGATATPAENITRWRCQLRRAFPDGEALVVLAADGEVSVKVRWTDAFWETETANQKTEFTVKSRI